MKIWKMCLNWKVLAGLAAVALGLWALAPGLIAGALPLLLLAVCPLSMLVMMPVMMRGTGGGRHDAEAGGVGEATHGAPMRDDVSG